MFKLAAMTALAAGALAKDTTVVVQTASGAVRGEENDGADRWRSIPFAAPPVGDLRFRSPQPVTPWADTLDTMKQRPACPQLDIASGIHLGDEDCMYLDVYRPHTDAAAGDENELLPVLFWIFGGGFSLGSDWEFGIYSAANLARDHGVVVVAPNYRVNIFGFLALDELQEEDEFGSTGNMGIQDQRFAMQWVQDNIAAFGGDPNSVTIFGESAGAFSVCHHLSNAAASADLFHGAIMESGTCDNPEFFQPLEDAKAFGAIFGSAMGCPANDNQLTCLRGLDTAHLMDSMFSWFFPTWPYPPLGENGTLSQEPWALPAGAGAPSMPGLPGFAPIMPWGPAVDGTTQGLPATPLLNIRDGKGMDVPLLAGFNQNEGAYFTLAMPLVVQGGAFPAKSAGDVEAAMTHVLTPLGKEDQTDVLMPFYTQDIWGHWDNALAMCLRDYVFTCPTRRVLRAQEAQGNDAFEYHFKYVNKWIDMQLMGDYHASDLWFVWGNSFPVIRPFSKTDKVVSNRFQTYWTNFGKTGTPNHPEPVDMLWPAFDSGNDTALVLDKDLSEESGYNAAACDAWDSVLGY